MHTHVCLTCICNRRKGEEIIKERVVGLGLCARAVMLLPEVVGIDF